MKSLKLKVKSSALKSNALQRVAGRFWSNPPSNKGITLLLVILVLSALLAISIGIFNLVFGEFRISGEISDSFVAFYAADRGMEKLLYMDRVADNVPGCGGSGACQWGPTGPYSLENGACFRLIYRRLGSGDALAIAGGEYRCGISALSVQRAVETIYSKSGGAIAEFGDGRDIFAGVGGSGFININQVSAIVGRTAADAVSYPVERSLLAGDNSIQIDCCAPVGIADGDEVLIINLQGRPGAIADVGLWEAQRVDRVTGRIIRLRSGLINSYDGTRDKIMVQRVPNYDRLAILSGQQFGADSWNGIKGGVFFIRVANVLTINPGGEINMVEKGFRGSNVGYNYWDDAGNSVEVQANPGESIASLGISASRNPNDGGGGGAARTSSGGGGGGYGVVGANGDSCNNSQTFGFGGTTYGGNPSSKLLLGSGGGGGFSCGICFVAGYSTASMGANGGGALAVFAQRIDNQGKMTANGGVSVGGFTGPPRFDAYASTGGGGSGGSLIVTTDLFSNQGTITADGGLGGQAPQGCFSGGGSGKGGDGGVGRTNYTPIISTPTADIKADGSDGPTTISFGGSATISWSSTNTTSCTVTPTGWTGTSGFQSTGSLTGSQTYSLSCTGPGGSASDSVVVNVLSAIFGTGADIFLGPAGNPAGFFSINSTAMIQGRTRPDAVNFAVLSAVAAGADRVDLGVTPNGIAQDDEVLIIVMQGSPSNTADVGLWETQRVKRVTGTRLEFKGTLQNAYDGTLYKVMLQRVPNYNMMNIPSYQQFGADSWSSATGKGGVFFIRIAGLLSIAGPSGEITSTGKGYAGGVQGGSSTQGESIAGLGSPGVRAANVGGGGAGTGRFSGGGGGGYANAGGNGDTGDAFGPGVPADAYGFGGSSYGSSSLTQRLFLGSGGGGSDGDVPGCEEASSPGTNGGGIVAVFAQGITNGGNIVSDGVSIPGYPAANAGGGGSGGSVLVRTSQFFSRGTIRASGGGGIIINYGGLCWSFPFWGSPGGGSVGRLDVTP